MSDIDGLLHGWEEIYKRGQLTFWILLSLRDRDRTSDEIAGFIQEGTNGHLTCETQSLYRALRRFLDVEMVTFETEPGNRGPDKKRYAITALGDELLQRFIERNVALLYSDNVKSLIRRPS